MIQLKGNQNGGPIDQSRAPEILNLSCLPQVDLTNELASTSASPWTKRINISAVTLILAASIYFRPVAQTVQASSSEVDQLRKTLAAQQENLDSVRYVVSELIKITKEKALQPTARTNRALPPSQKAIPPIQNGQLIQVRSNKANLRLGPSSEYGVLMQVTKGTKLLGDKEIHGWMRVTAPNGETCWVSRENYALIGD